MAEPDTTDTKHLIGERLKTARELAGLTQSQVAERLSVAEMTVYRWETGRFEPSFAKLQALANLLQQPMEGLLGGIPTAGESGGSPESNASAPVAHVRLKGYLSAGLSRDDWDADLGTVPVSEHVALQYPGLYALVVSGDSLESQGIRSDDLLFLDPAASLRSDKLYVIRTETGELSLRVMSLEEGRILLRSGFDRYEELAINGAEFLGQVVWHLRRMD